MEKRRRKERRRREPDKKKKKEGDGTAHYAGVTFRNIYPVRGIEGLQGGMAARIYTKAVSATFSMEA